MASLSDLMESLSLGGGRVFFFPNRFMSVWNRSNAWNALGLL